MKKTNWLSENIVSIIALSFIFFAFYTFRIILLKQINATETTTTNIVNSITNIMMLIVGYYFGSSKDKGKPTVGNIENVDVKAAMGVLICCSIVEVAYL